jgi:Ca-activated chloride channel homolog
MRAQLWILNLTTAVIVASGAVVAFAPDPQKVSLKLRAEPALGKIDTIITMTAINVSITDGDNRPISNLDHKDFAIFEDGDKQEIAFLFHDETSVSFGLAFDISDYEPLKVMTQRAVRNLVKEIRSANDIAIPQLETGNETVREFTADDRKLDGVLSGVSSKNQLAGLVAETIKAARKKSKDPRSAVVVITDGLSLSGAARDRDEAYAILRQGTPVYFIILDDGRFSARPDMQSRLRQTRKLLTRLAQVSGGLASVVKNEGEISAATEQIIRRLKAQYTFGYYPTDERFDGSFRNIRVIITPKDKRKVKLFAPSGYYAVGPEKIREEKFNDRK